MAIGIPAYEQLIDILREEIISGVIPADTRLTILEIAKRFGVSQMPVREAFQRLQGEGLIKGTPHKGVRVITIDATFVRNIYEVRGVMEGLLARDTRDSISDSDIKKLEIINNKIASIALDGSVEETLSFDREFHMEIYRHSKNSVALEIHNTFTSLLATLRSKYGFGPHRIDDLIEQHQKILTAFRSGDASGIEHTIREHRAASMEDLLPQMGMNRQKREGG